MRPVLIELLGIPISAFGVFLLLGFGVAITRARRAAQRNLGLDPNWTLDLALYMIIVGIIGGRLGYILANPWEFIGAPINMIRIWSNGGLTYYGALAAALLFGRAYAGRQPVAFGRLLDLLAGPLVLGYGIAMIGALLHGLFPGTPTGVPWAAVLAIDPAPRHPVPAYMLVGAVAILAILRAQRDRQLPAGTLFVLVLFLQAFARFVSDVFVDRSLVAGPMLREAITIGPLTLGQLASLLVMLVAVVVLVVLQRRSPDAGSEPTAEVPA